MAERTATQLTLDLASLVDLIFIQLTSPQGTPNNISHMYQIQALLLKMHKHLFHKKTMIHKYILEICWPHMLAPVIKRCNSYITEHNNHVILIRSQCLSMFANMPGCQKKTPLKILKKFKYLLVQKCQPLPIQTNSLSLV